MVSEQQVWLENIRNNQIGGETDGITHEVAEDLGFRPPALGLIAIKRSIQEQPEQLSLNDKIYKRIDRNADPWRTDTKDYCRPPRKRLTKKARAAKTS